MGIEEGRAQASVLPTGCKHDSWPVSCGMAEAEGRGLCSSQGLEHYTAQQQSRPHSEHQLNIGDRSQRNSSIYGEIQKPD